jgi:hypothetical protein
MANSSLLTCAAVTPVLIVLAGSAAASEVRCVRGDDAIRRVEIAVQDPNQNVPCEVVYWKDTEQPGVRTVLWNAQTDADFCERKADELVAKLQGGGWSCTASGEERAASRPTPTAVESSPTESSAPPSAAAKPDSSRATTDQAPPAAVAEPAPSPQPAPTVRAALAPPPAEIEPGPAQAEVPPGGAALDAIIQQNLARLNDGVDGKFAAEIAAYGDLNGDGLEDGLVFFTYESQRLGQARFVAAYLFDGDSYTLAATKPLAGSDHNVQSAKIESIEDSVIALRLTILEPGDAACCPSGTRDEVLVLRDGQLVDERASASHDASKP